MLGPMDPANAAPEPRQHADRPVTRGLAWSTL